MKEIQPAAPRTAGRMPGICPRAAVRLVVAAGLCALALVGCTSGTLTDSEQSCRSSGGFFAEQEVSCTGSVGTASGEPSLGIIDADGELQGAYRLRATISAGEGSARVTVGGADGGSASGEVSPGEPLQLDTTLELDENDEEITAGLRVSGEELRDLRYDVTATPLR